MQAAGHATATVELDVLSGWNEQWIELRAIEPRQILVCLSCEGNDVPAVEEAWTSTTVTDGAGRSVLLGRMVRKGRLQDGGCSDGASAILTVDGPGTYRVEMPRVPGFEPPAPNMVTVGAERATLGLELVHTPRATR